MKATYDKVADAMYFRFKTGKISRTQKLEDKLIVDLDKKGNILGLEILDASSQISKQNIASTIKAGRIPLAI
ncbi:MAG TPA: DUF2283 domain-containing protein [Candidatus Paceibacterota bacterium]|nr:DUF2283 domain-containing protein [Candidatus Paceibacterota bacterium]